jgi:hypothetical protein
MVNRIITLVVNRTFMLVLDRVEYGTRLRQKMS